MHHADHLQIYPIGLLKWISPTKFYNLRSKSLKNLTGLLAPFPCSRLQGEFRIWSKVCSRGDFVQEKIRIKNNFF